MSVNIGYFPSRGFTIEITVSLGEEVALLRAFAEFAKKGKVKVGEIKRIDKSTSALEISAIPKETKFPNRKVVKKKIKEVKS